MDEFLLMLARMSDVEVIEYAEKFGLTPRPDPDGESMSNFRMRVIHVLRPDHG